MRFVSYGSSLVRGIKVDWEASVELTDEIRRAMHPEEVEQLRVGRLQRPFHVQSSRLGTRSGRGADREDIVHPKNSLTFATSAEDRFWVQADDTPRGGRKGHR